MERQKFCTQCRHPNRLEAKFCKQCGHRFRRFMLVSTIEICPRCHTARHSGSKFCRNCGYQFVPSQAPIQQPRVEAVELPPPANIPLIEPEQNSIEPETPASTGKTGILISQEELGKIRQAKTEQIIFVPALRRKKNS
jgi:hypothetical protein